MRFSARCYIYFSFFCSLWKCKDHFQSKMTQKQATVQTGPSVRKLLLDGHSQHRLLNEYTQKCTPSSPSSLALPPFSSFIISLSTSPFLPSSIFSSSLFILPFHSCSFFVSFPLLLFPSHFLSLSPIFAEHFHVLCAGPEMASRIEEEPCLSRSL